MVPLMLEEEDHQLGLGGVEAEAEAEEEVLQGLLLYSMCRNDQCLGYVITSEWFIVYDDMDMILACGDFIFVLVVIETWEINGQ